MPCKHSLEVTAEQLEWLAKLPWTYVIGNETPLDELLKQAMELYASIPKTISINGHEVPEPMREKPEIGDKYWAVSSLTNDGSSLSTWHNDSYDLNRFNRGQCHLTRDNCIAHAKALFSFSEIKE